MKARKEGQKKSKRWEERMTKRKKNERSGDEKNEQTKEWRLRAGGRDDDGPSPGGVPPLSTPGARIIPCLAEKLSSLNFCRKWGWEGFSPPTSHSLAHFCTFISE